MRHPLRSLAAFIALASLSAPSAVAADNAAAIVKKPGHVYICSFNVYRLGCVADKYNAAVADDEDFAVSSDIPQRVKNLAEVLAFGAFDLIVFQEVSAGIQGEMVMTDLCQQLKDEHGLSYSYFLSGPIGAGFNMTEAMAFMYDPAVLQPELLPGQTAITEIIPVPGRDFVRTQWEAGDFDFTLVSVHLAWGNESDRDAGYEMVEEILETPTPSRFSDDPDIIVLGDFNRFGSGMESVKLLTEEENLWFAPNVLIFDPGFNERKSVTVSSVAGRGIPNNNPQLLSTTVAANTFVYDMFLLTGDVAEEFPAGRNTAVFGEDFGIIHFDEPDGIAFQPAVLTLTAHNAIKEAYSDHRPLWYCFKNNTGNNDDEPGGITLSPAIEPVVFVATEHGTRFHRQGCRTIQGRNIPRIFTDRADALAELLPCRVCEP